MAIWQARSKRKPSGGLYHAYRKKKAHEIGSLPTYTKLGPEKRKVVRTRGGSTKQRLLSADVVNLLNPKTKSYTIAKILSIVKSPANVHYVRRGIITKGTIIKTDKGDARILSRPGQEGRLNAVLLTKE